MIEPLCDLPGVKDARARALQAGGAGFSRVRLLGGSHPMTGAVVGVSAVPAPWREALTRVGAAPGADGLPAGPSVMGILNVTPDSFSDGGVHLRPGDAIAAGLGMIEGGAAFLDIGGESTRPGAAVIDPVEEQARILPVLAGLRGRGALISIDTRNAATMRACLDDGADLINDVSALTHDPAAAGVLAGYRCPVVLMHMRGTPATMTGLARYGDVAAEVAHELAARIEAAEQAGIARCRIVVDPGIGFAKDTAQNLELLRRLPVLANLGCRILLGVSRKRFLGVVSGIEDPAARGPGSIVAGLAGLAFPGTILRVHDVPAMVQALRVWQAIRG